ncbi:gluconate 2-dehydrogenase subunit 3 family protein [Bradyrhizobium cenepequi]
MPPHLSTRRQLLAATAWAAISISSASADTITRRLPWRPAEAYPPEPARPGPWLFFTADEAATVEAIVDRLVPADELGPGGKDAGCAVFIDRQLAGPYGRNDGLYMEGPFPSNALATQGLQSPLTPREQYRQGLAALTRACREAYGGRVFPQLSAEEQDRVLASMEKGELELHEFDSKMLFGAMLANTMEGFFADPIYGGNRDMCGWKLIGFPGVRYDYREMLDRPNQAYTRPPVSLQGRPDWNRNRT